MCSQVNQKEVINVYITLLFNKQYLMKYFSGKIKQIKIIGGLKMKAKLKVKKFNNDLYMVVIDNGYKNELVMTEKCQKKKLKNGFANF